MHYTYARNHNKGPLHKKWKPTKFTWIQPINTAQLIAVRLMQFFVQMDGNGNGHFVHIAKKKHSARKITHANTHN